MRLTKTGYGNYDCANLANWDALDEQRHVSRLPAPQEALDAAGVEYGRALVGFRETRRHYAPRFDGWLIDADWEDKVAASETATQIVEKEKAKRRERGKRAAAKAKAAKHTKAALESAGAYGELLDALRNAAEASATAKTRAANGVHYSDWWASRSAYDTSRRARARDYDNKASELRRAVAAAAQVDGLVWGWQCDHRVERDYVGECYGCDGQGCDDCDYTGDYYVSRTNPAPYVVYFELPTGQVSFHSKTRLDGPDYEGEWDGDTAATPQRIAAAIENLVAESESLQAA